MNKLLETIGWYIGNGIFEKPEKTLRAFLYMWIIFFSVLMAVSCSKEESAAPLTPDDILMMSDDPWADLNLTGPTGTLNGGYGLTGTFRVDGEGIYINNDYQGNTAPGPVWYLSNSSSNIDNGVSLGSAPKTAGAHKLTTQQALDFKYLVLWCDPFSVRIGHGEIPK